jgi:hypothetical protein
VNKNAKAKALTATTNERNMKNPLNLAFWCAPLVMTCSLTAAEPAVNTGKSAQEALSLEDRIGKVVSSGKINLNTRLRYENADSTTPGIQSANAITFRTRLGYTTDNWNGLKGMIEFENVSALGGEDNYRNAPGPSANVFDHDVVADPEGTEVNQVWMGYEKWDSVLKFGRQNFTLDNHRFIGNVVWRQNLQTYDAVTLINKSIEDLTATYGYIFGVNRIFGPEFGDAAGPADGRWQSNSHVFHLKYDKVPYGSLVGYAYLLDLDEAPALSTSTYGLYYAGKAPLSDAFNLTYRAEFAYQTDYADNAADLNAEYINLQLGGEYQRFSAGIGYEVLGSDNAAMGFTTPLSTLHAFQGWADMLLATPAGGIEDYQAWIGVKLPYEIPLKVIYHDLRPQEGGGGDYGNELDIVATRQFGKYFSGLVKYAYFNGESGMVDVNKFWAQVEFAF